MFDFEKLSVYQKSKNIHKEIKHLLKDHNVPKHFIDQFSRASSSVILNIAEGTSKFSKADRRNFYTITRGSAHECVAILQLLFVDKIIDSLYYNRMYNEYEAVSKMLFGLIESQKK